MKTKYVNLKCEHKQSIHHMYQRGTKLIIYQARTLFFSLIRKPNISHWNDVCKIDWNWLKNGFSFISLRVCVL